MKTNEFLRVKNFEKYQHYSKRNPPWIKLYYRILSDPEFSIMSAASKMHTIAIMLLASQHDNKIPFNKKWIAQVIIANERINWDEIFSSGFVICYQDASVALASRKRSAITETETETETETDISIVSLSKKCETGFKCNGEFEQCQIDFELFWNTYPRHDPPRKPSRCKWCVQYKSGIAIPELISWIEKAKRGWTEKKFIPQPTTFLNQRRWEGDLPPGSDAPLLRQLATDEDKKGYNPNARD